MQKTSLFVIVAMLGFATGTTLLFQQDVSADGPSNPDCITEEFSLAARNTPLGVGDELSALAHEWNGLGDDIKSHRESEGGLCNP